MLQYPLNTIPINETEWNKNMYLLSINTKADPGTARRVPPPSFEKKGLVFVNFHCIYADTLILVNMQC